jgi:hypothetical protein
MESYCKEIRALSCTDPEPRADFIEATVYSRNEAVVTVGRFSEAPTGTVFFPRLQPSPP